MDSTPISPNYSLKVVLTISFVLISSSQSSTLIEELNTLRPPPDFNSTITKNCLHNPSLRYCKFSSQIDLNEIFKFTIVASHLCNESKNPNCVESFPKIDLKNRPKIAPLYISFDFFWKYCPIDIISIDISNNSIKGNFPKDVLLCTQIKFLDLSFNELSGEIPVENFFPLTNLTLLNLSYNHFSESEVTAITFFNQFNSSSFIHSGLFPSDHHHYTIKAIMFLVCFPIFIILIICFFGWLCFSRPDYLPKMFQKRYKFTVPIIKAATNNFSKKNLLSKLEGVAIYKGILRDNTKVKIEVYKGNNVISRDDRRRFIEECRVLVELRHPNLVRVLGWCSNRRLRSIVTEWTNNGENIELWLSGSDPPPWKDRLKVMIGVVEDIYKFGVFLLEMIVNKRPREEFDGGEAGFIEFVRSHFPENLPEVIDKRMKLKEHMLDQAKHGIGLGLMCTDQASGKIPSLYRISDMITKVYKSCLNLESNKNYRRPHQSR